MTKRFVFVSIACLLPLSGCASANNGQVPEATEGQSDRAASKEADSGPVQEGPTIGEKNESAAVSKREQAVLDCQKCNGQWGRHGLARVESCICRTSDFKKPCRDGDDCEGICLLQDSEFRCSEFKTVFGCHVMLPKGWSKRSVKDEQAAPKICID